MKGCIRVACFLLFHFYVVYGYLCRHKIRSARLKSTYVQVARPSGYIPPEMDPEFRKDAQKLAAIGPLSPTPDDQTAEEAKFASLPVPKEGDIVQYEDDYNASQIGKIRYLQYIDSYNSFYVDIIPLAEGKSPGVFVINRKAKAEYKPLSQVRPVKAYYLRSDDGYKVSFKKDTKEVVLKASQFKPVDKAYGANRKIINFDAITNDFQDYQELKKRITFAALKVGGVGSLLLGCSLGPDVVPEYALGVFSGCAYFYLLSKKVDAIGDKYSVLSLAHNPSPSATSPVDSATPTPAQTTPFAPRNLLAIRRNELLSPLRFILPIASLGALSYQKIYVDHYVPPHPLHLLPEKDFLVYAGGFLTLRMAIYISEVLKEFRLQDIVGILPGSLAITLRNMLQMRAEEKNDVEINMQKKVIFMSGPVAGGRWEVCDHVLRTVNQGETADAKSRDKIMVYEVIKLLTTDERYKDQENMWFEYISLEDLASMQSQGEIAYSGYDYDPMGILIPLYLRGKPLQGYEYTSQKDYKERGVKDSRRVGVVVGPPSLLDILISTKSIRLTAMWISMNTKNQFIQQATKIVKKQLLLPSSLAVSSSLPQQLAEQVGGLVDEAAKGVGYFTSRAPLFDFTLLNEGGDQKDEVGKEGVVAEILQIFKNMRV